MRRIILLLVLVAAGAAITWYATREQPVAVAVASVNRGLVRSVVANTRVGTVKACRRAKMSPAAAGRVAVLNVEAGDRVEKDAILLEVWNEDLKAEVQLAQSEISAVRSRADEACAMSAGAEREANRLKKLSERRLVSEEAVDEAVTNAETRIAACKATVATTWVQNAKLNVAREKLERTILRAPFSGVVAEVDAKLGEYLTPSPPGIATLPAIDLIDRGCLYVSAPIDEVDAPLIKTDMSACITLDAFEGKRCAARVKRIADYVMELEKTGAHRRGRSGIRRRTGCRPASTWLQCGHRSIDRTAGKCIACADGGGTRWSARAGVRRCHIDPGRKGSDRWARRLGVY